MRRLSRSLRLLALAHGEPDLGSRGELRARFAFWEITRPSLTLAENVLVTFPTEQCARSSYGQLDVRVTVFEVIGMPGIAGVLSEPAEVPVAVAE
jgi:hypothetical protein